MNAQKPNKTTTLLKYTSTQANKLQEMGRERTAETYLATLRSLTKFTPTSNLPLKAITKDFVERYEAYLKQRGVVPNTISFYMRILRAIYNRAVEDGLIKQNHPFKRVYTGIAKTHKRAISLKSIQQIKRLNLSASPELEFTRDIFLLSFYTRGMAFVDMAYLKTSNICGNTLLYRRRKTGQMINIRWEEDMVQIVSRYAHLCDDYLLPIIKKLSEKSPRQQYISIQAKINQNLKKIACLVEIDGGLTLYVARHSWAVAARDKDIPLSVISEGMGHDNETTTKVYLTSIDNSVIDNANKLIMSAI